LRPAWVADSSCCFDKIDQEPESCFATDIPFKSGETLTFKAFYNLSAAWVGAGEIHFKVREENKEGENQLHVRSLAQTLPAFDDFYPVRDRYESWLDPQTLLAEKFVRDIDEGGFTFFRSYEYDRDNDKVHSYFERLDRQEHNELEISSCSQDVLSLFYYIRSIDYSSYEPGDLIPIKLLVDAREESLSMRFMGREQCKTRLGTFNCILLEPELIAGDYFKDKNGMKLWISDDQNKLPIRAEAQILVGSLKADLKSYSGLRYPLTSRVN
jgi:hypothetical protein